MFAKLRQHRFLFEELVKRDFKKKYKRTLLGMGWSVLMPLLTLLVMKIVFEQFFGRNMRHYTTYLFCGNLLFCWFSWSIIFWSFSYISLISSESTLLKRSSNSFCFLMRFSGISLYLSSIIFC